ncbi:S-protein homolog 1-like [Momordica charantia]|uniref:S-protein homolog n=1 Tax=Momordica charantia TaxID=3673 RepID=A0A6J1CPR8_MOMCH|nr:S-protein homolog 1-like [Momordica charantia]
MEGRYPKHFLVFLFVSSLAIVEQIEAVPLSKWQIHVRNELSNTQMLFVHCKSKNDDLGEHNLSVGTEFNWRFRVNIWDTTLYWCYLQKPNGQSVSFDAFWVEKDSIWLYYKCLESNCTWKAKDDGIYLRNNPDGRDVFVHKWP